jgi:flagellar L-ring protein precursor FlgH
MIAMNKHRIAAASLICGSIAASIAAAGEPPPAPAKRPPVSKSRPVVRAQSPAPPRSPSPTDLRDQPAWPGALPPAGPPSPNSQTVPSIGPDIDEGRPATSTRIPYERGVPSPFLSPLTAPVPMRAMSLVAVIPTPPKKIQVHDIVSILVSERSEVIQNAQFMRQKNITFVAQLRQWVRIDDHFRLRPAALDSPQINTQLRSQMQAFGNNRSSELMTFRIAATVVDVLPNGNLVLEAKKTIQTNEDLWSYTLTGICRSQDIQANNEIMSERIVDLKTIKNEYGKVPSSTARGYLMRLYDYFLPF